MLKLIFSNNRNAILIILCLLIFGCAKKTPQKNLPAAPAIAPVATPEETPKQQPAKTEANAPAGMKGLRIKLPRRAVIGTPEPVNVSNVEKSTGQLRGPFFAPIGTTNVAAGKTAKASQELIIGDLGMLTDGDKEPGEGSFLEFGPGVTHVTIDLEADYVIYAIVIWHYHQQVRVYFDVIVQVSDDPEFKNDVKTLFNNDDDNSAGQGIGTNKNYSDTYEGRLFDAKGVTGRYVRLYSNGNSGNELNHYVEVEVYGKAAK